MRKFTCIIIFIFFSTLVKAQLKFEASSKYGKLWDITYDATTPNRLYGLTLINHIMVSNNNGLTWHILYTYPTDKGYLANLKIAPGGKELSFVVKNQPDPQKNGLYLLSLATNTIKTSFIPPNWEVNPAVTSYSIYNNKDSVVLLNTSYQDGFAPYTKVFYTADAGANWKEVYYSGDNDDVQINNAVINPANPEWLAMMRGLGPTDVDGGLFMSKNSGDSWVKKLPGKALDQLAYNPTNPLDMWLGTGIDFVAADEALYHSTDGGDTWDSVTNLPLHYIEYGLNNFTRISFDPTDANKIWLLEENEYLATADGGAHWKSFAFEPDDATYYYGTNITINPFNAAQLFICSDGWPQYSDDGGTTLTQARNAFYNVTNLAYANYGTSRHLYYASQGGYLEKNMATGVSTHYLIESPFTVNGHFRTLIPDTAVDGRVFMYTPGDGFFSTSTLSISNDYGSTFKTVPCDDFSNAIEKIKKDPNDAYTYWISYAEFDMGTLFKVNIEEADAPVSTPVTTPGEGRITGIYIFPASPDSVLITQGATVYVTADGGATWQESANGITGLATGQDIIWALESNPFNSYQLIISTNKGCFISNDGGKNWAPTLAEHDIRRISFSSAVNGDVAAAQYSTQDTDCRLFYSTNSGGTWKDVEPALFNNLQSNKIDFDFFADSINVYFATADVGVARYQLKDLRGTLPLHLLSFTGSIKNDNALLQWNTTAEQNLQGYQLQRSKDGRAFNAIHTTAAINEPGNQAYNYTDEDFAPYSGKENSPVYYRLKMMDADGQYSYSNTIRLARTGALVEDVTMYPNPVVNTVNLRLHTGAGGNYAVKIVDAAGRQCYSSTRTLSAGTSTVGIPVSSLAKGVYIITIQPAGGKAVTMKFVK